MAVRLEGVVELRKALRKFEPDLAKALNSELRTAMKPVVSKARGFVPSTGSVLSNWQTGKVNPESRWGNRAFDSGQVKRGIKFKIAPSKTNNRGFKALASIINASAAGAIFETAGRKNPWGRPTSHLAGRNKTRVTTSKDSNSANPMAGRDFIAAANALSPMTGRGNDKGRLIYRAWEEDQGKAQDAVIRAIEKAARIFQNRTAA